MYEKEIRKAFNVNIYLIIFALLLLIPVTYFSLKLFNTDRVIQPNHHMETAISTNAVEQDDYVYLNVKDISLMEGTDYYKITDTNNKTYVSTMNSEYYENIKEQLNTEKNVQINGFAHMYTDSMKSVILKNSHIHDYEFNLYYGKYFFKQTNYVRDIQLHFYRTGLTGFGFILLIILIFIVYKLYKVRKATESFDKDELIYQMNEPETLYMNDAQVWLTQDYIISTKHTFEIFDMVDVSVIDIKTKSHHHRHSFSNRTYYVAYARCIGNKRRIFSTNSKAEMFHFIKMVKDKYPNIYVDDNFLPF